jgi:cytochrome c oxidase subunit III
VSEHPPHLAHHFETPQQQFASNKLGMWVFLATEVLFFSGLFVAYAVYRANHPEVFIHASQLLDKSLGGLNTVVLITSSFTMALAVRLAMLGQTRRLVVALVVTLVLAGGFLGVKGIEYQHKWKHGLLWGQHYDPHHADEHGEEEHALATAHAEAGAAHDEGGEEDAGDERSNIARSATGPAGLASPGESHVIEPMDEPSNVHVFFGIYFAMTGLHGLHVIIGMGLILWLILRARRGEFNRGYFTPVDLVGLYWHLVDLIWIFLFPLLYLIG